MERVCVDLARIDCWIRGRKPHSLLLSVRLRNDVMFKELVHQRLIHLCKVITLVQYKSCLVQAVPNTSHSMNDSSLRDDARLDHCKPSK
jgi:hypothetical protein